MSSQRTRAQISRDAIERLYIAMRHLFIRGFYKPLGTSGEAIMDALLSLKPEIYGSIADEEKVELSGLLYIFQRLPVGIEECRYIKLIGREGFEDSGFEPIVPAKRRRNCYRIDEDQMYIEMSRGRSDIYDVLTHLTFMFIESEKIRRNSLDYKNRPKKEWLMLEKMVLSGEEHTLDEHVGYTYLSTLLGRTFEEAKSAGKSFNDSDSVNSLFSIVYHLGKGSMLEFIDDIDREISFSSGLREKVGHHIYGEIWANQIRNHIFTNNLHEKPLHIISANMHSVINCLYAKQALGDKVSSNSVYDIASELSKKSNKRLNKKVEEFALRNGMSYLEDSSGMNIRVQLIECDKIPDTFCCKELNIKDKCDALLLVMDYAFGEQAYETMDELLKPHEVDGVKQPLNVASINIMGKAGILCGEKGDLMLPSAHVFEGTADNYPFVNQLKREELEGHGLEIFEGTMVTVLGTSLQNKDILRYFLKSSWKGIGLEMEGAHYQKAIQAASKIRNSIDPNVDLRYAYYASDNPLHSGSTLASGSLGMEGVTPTYLITSRFLHGIMCK